MKKSGHNNVELSGLDSFGLLSISKEGMINYANSLISGLLGYLSDEIVGKSVEEIIESESWNMLHENATSQNLVAISLTSKDGIRLTHAARLVGEIADDTNLVIIDITSRGKSLLDEVQPRGLHLITIDSQGSIVDISFHGSQQLGWKLEEIQGKPFQEVFSHGDISHHPRQLHEIVAGETFEGQLSLKSKNGHLHSLAMRVEQDQDNADQKRLIQKTDSSAVGSSILKQEIINQILLRSHTAQTLEDLIRGATELLKRYSHADAVGLRLQDGKEFPYFEISGFSNTFTTAEDFICNHSTGSLQCFCGAVIEQKKVEGIKGFNSFGSFVTNDSVALMRQIPKDNSIFEMRGKCMRDGYLSLAMIPLRLRGKSFGILQFNSMQTDAFPDTIIKDLEEIADYFVIAISNFRSSLELQEVNLSLESQNSKLETINEELRLFAASVTHDLRSPLNQMKQYLKLIRSELEQHFNDRLRGYFGRAQQLVPKMQEMITSFIELTRIIEVDPVLQNIDLGEMAEKILAEVKFDYPKQRIRSDIASKMMVRADAGLLRIVLSNLMNNAVKYSSQRKYSTLTIARAKNEGAATFYIRDNGIGIVAEELDKLFIPFKRLSNAQSIAGTGIGLVSAQRAMERMGGRIWCESKLDEGTTFFIQFADETMQGQN